eukprot:TRINITY_DN15756_c0_g1_i1.p1 TRINITY_DN15756_c0_g1~~TRINITY_DN15756_c0_g1_i1.p1  ORF type:complete len:594 (-),score=145.32 TRINITY_DN15756_c0_g1_i1:45-1724(-)
MDEAINYFELACKVNPLSSAAWFWRGYCLYFIERFEEAFECYEEASLLDPTDIHVWNNKALALQRLGRFKESIKYFDEALNIQSDNVTSYIYKGFSLVCMGSYDEGMACYDQAVQLPTSYDNMKKSDAWIYKGLALHLLGRYEETIPCFDESLNLNRRNSYAWNDKGYALLNLGRYEESVICFDEAIKIRADNANPWNNRVKSMQRLENYDAMLHCYDQSIKINSQDSDVWFDKATCLMNMSRFEESLKAFGESLHINPNNSDAWNYKGLIHFKLSNYNISITCFDKSIELNPKNKSAINNKKCVTALLATIEGPKCPSDTKVKFLCPLIKVNEHKSFEDAVFLALNQNLLKKDYQELCQRALSKRMEKVEEDIDLIDLSEEEYLAIFFYTTCLPNTAPIEQLLNQVLENENENEWIQNISNWKYYMNYLLDALCKLCPDFHSDLLYQSLTFDITQTQPDIYQLNHTISFPTFLSTTTEKDSVLKVLSDDKPTTLLIIQKHFSGRSITSFSSHNENEVLFPPNSTFLITNITNQNKRTHIYLKQIPSLEPHLFETRTVQ